MTSTKFSLTPHDLVRAPTSPMACSLSGPAHGETVIVRKEASLLDFANSGTDGELVRTLGTQVHSLDSAACTIGETGRRLASNRVNDSDSATDGSA